MRTKPDSVAVTGLIAYSTMRGSAANTLCLLMAVSACGGPASNPLAPSPSLPDAQGQYVGLYVISTCVAEGFLAGTCPRVGEAGGQVRLSLTQSRDALSGVLTLSGGVGTASGSFSGTVTSAGSISGSASLGSLNLPGGPATQSITDWNTSLMGDRLSGSFVLVTSTTAPVGRRTITAALSDMARVATTGSVGGIWSGRGEAPDGSLDGSSAITFVLAQRAADVTGTITWFGLNDAAMFSGPMSGTLMGTSLTFTFTATLGGVSQPCVVTGNGSAEVTAGRPPQGAPGNTLLVGSYSGGSSCVGGRFATARFSLTRQ